MRPTGFTHLVTKFRIEDVILTTPPPVEEDDKFVKIKAEILTCFYGSTKP